MFLKLLFTILACSMFFCNIQNASAQGVKPSILSVTGNGQAFYLPDMTILAIGVETFSQNSVDAQEENARRASALYNFLLNFGIKKENIKTTRYDFFPVYSEKDNERNKIVGYQAKNRMEIKIHGTDKIGEIIDCVLKNGANQVYSLNFTLEDIGTAEKEALLIATQNAKEKAKVIAKGLGKTIIGIESVIANEDRFSPICADNSLSLRESAKMNSATPILSGMLECKVNVDVNFILSND